MILQVQTFLQIRGGGGADNLELVVLTSFNQDKRRVRPLSFPAADRSRSSQGEKTLILADWLSGR